jgi:hypothetical protein
MFSILTRGRTRNSPVFVRKGVATSQEVNRIRSKTAREDVGRPLQNSSFSCARTGVYLASRRPPSVVITDLSVMRTQLILPVYSWSALYATKFFGAFSSLDSFGSSALSAYSPDPTIGPSSQAFPSGAHPYRQ